jgi:hypothetical protein
MVEPYIILFTAVGIASENLMLAGLTGEGYTITRSGNWILNMFFILVFQIEILRMGCWFGNLVTEPVNGMDQWLAIGLIMSTGIRMLQKCCLSLCFWVFPDLAERLRQYKKPVHWLCAFIYDDRLPARKVSLSKGIEISECRGQFAGAAECCIIYHSEIKWRTVK